MAPVGHREVPATTALPVPVMAVPSAAAAPAQGCLDAAGLAPKNSGPAGLGRMGFGAHESSVPVVRVASGAGARVDLVACRRSGDLRDSAGAARLCRS